MILVSTIFLKAERIVPFFIVCLLTITRLLRLTAPPFAMVGYAKMFFSMNELFTDSEKTHAFSRRLSIIEFSETIPHNEQILDLAKQIIDTELSGVLNWIIDGLKRILKRGKLPIVYEVEKARENFRIDSDPVLQWVIERQMIPGNVESIPLKVAYSGLTEFLRENNNRLIGKKQFSIRLRRNGFEITKLDGRDMFISYSTGDFTEKVFPNKAETIPTNRRLFDCQESRQNRKQNKRLKQTN